MSNRVLVAESYDNPDVAQKTSKEGFGCTGSHCVFGNDRASQNIAFLRTIAKKWGSTWAYISKLSRPVPFLSQPPDCFWDCVKLNFVRGQWLNATLCNHRVLR